MSGFVFSSDHHREDLRLGWRRRRDEIEFRIRVINRPSAVLAIRSGMLRMTDIQARRSAIRRWTDVQGAGAVGLDCARYGHWWIVHRTAAQSPKRTFLKSTERRLPGVSRGHIIGETRRGHLVCGPSANYERPSKKRRISATAASGASRSPIR